MYTDRQDDVVDDLVTKELEVAVDEAVDEELVEVMTGAGLAQMVPTASFARFALLLPHSCETQLDTKFTAPIQLQRQSNSPMSHPQYGKVSVTQVC